jgi:formylglycine-generating enzyme required for sulfatase activity
MPLTHLDCGGTQVVELSPLKGMPLTLLNCSSTRVSDLSPLKGMPLTVLYCNNTRVSDLSPLKGMPLTLLTCGSTRVSDLSPLKGMPLKEVYCDFRRERDAEILRSITTLGRINGKPAAEFWKESDKRDVIRPAAPPGPGNLPKIGEVIEVPLTSSLRMQFAWVPPGDSWLGGGDGNPGTTRFTLKQGLWCGVYPVTQAEWQGVMGTNPSLFQGNPRYPVEQVSWHAVQQFIEKLNQQGSRDGLLYRLPDEQEWEYLCRGGPLSREQSQYHFYFARSRTDRTPTPSNVLSSTQANFDGNSPAGAAAKGPYLRRPSEVGLYLPNPLGIYDLHGNVWQWTSSSEGWRRVMRGGSWFHPGVVCSASSRFIFAPGRVFEDVGFRLLAVPSGK